MLHHFYFFTLYFR